MSRVRVTRGGLWIAGVALGISGCGQLAQDGPPACAITGPAPGHTALVGQEIAFGVSASDGGTTTELLEIAWTSDRDGVLATGTIDPTGEHGFGTGDLSLGMHTVRATVTDEQGEVCVDTVDVQVHLGGVPHVEILVPLPDGFFYVDRPLTLRTRASDPEDDPEELRVHWALAGGIGLAEGLVPDAAGENELERSLEIGTHELVVTVADTQGNVARSSVTVTVGGPNQPPVCGFRAPVDGSSVPYGVPTELRGEATDPNVPPPWLSASFSSDVDGPLGDVTPDDDGDVALTVPRLTAGAHVLTLHVVDDLGVSCDDVVAVLVDEPPTVVITAPTVATVPSSNLPTVLQGAVSDLEDDARDLTIRWLSDGALIADQPSDAAGLLDDEAASLSPGPHTITLEATDSAGGVGVATVDVVVNAPPDAPTVVLGPPIPVTLDDLVATITVDAQDPEQDAISYAYSWIVNGVTDPSLVLPTLDHSMTAHFQVWSVEVRAFDGWTYGPPGTATVTIDNTPPQGGSATVSPVLGTLSGAFSLTTTGWSDADNDPEGYLYQWVVAGNPVPGATSATFVPGASGTVGDALHCELTPWDGTDTGVMFLSGPAFINAPATVGSVAIGPTTAYETTTLTATVTGVSDPEGATTTVLYQWYRNPGAPVAIPGANGPTLGGADFDHFDDISLGVSVDDGTEVGPETVSNVVPILNTPPSTSAPSISPSLLYTETVATCVPGPLVDPDPDTVTWTYSWTVAGTVVPGQTSATLDGAFWFDRGQAVACAVAPWDGFDAGSTETSNPRVVLNTGPTAPVVEITPQTPGDDNPLSCGTATPSFDADGDTVSYARSWALGTGSTPYTSQTLLASVTSLNDVWTCALSPWDGFVAGPTGSDSVTIQPTLAFDPGPAGNTYSQQAQTRGMWFVAPANFAITSLYVPDDTNAGDVQNVQVLLLPPGFGAGSSTAAATTLLYEVHQTAGAEIVTNIPVLAGDIIGILGARGTSTMNSMYSPGPAPVGALLDSTAIPLQRLEYQDNLWSVAAGSVHDAGGPIGRVEFDYIP